MDAPHDGQVQGIDHSQKGDDANRRRALFHLAGLGRGVDDGGKLIHAGGQSDSGIVH